jgi:tRNA 2-thiouridine synthesizing protein C
MKKRFLFINHKPPYGSFAAKESLDALLMASAFEQTIQVLFLGDGVFQLKKDQQRQAIATKNIAANLAALAVYDIKDIFVAKTDLTSRGLTTDDLILPVKALSTEQVSQLMNNQDVILSF